MRIDISRHRLFLAVGEGWGRQAGKHFIEDEHFDIGLGFLLLPEPVKCD